MEFHIISIIPANCRGEYPDYDEKNTLSSSVLELSVTHVWEIAFEFLFQKSKAAPPSVFNLFFSRIVSRLGIEASFPFFELVDATNPASP